MRSTFKILMYLKKGSEKPNGNVPLMCRLTVDGEIKQFSCKLLRWENFLRSIGLPDDMVRRLFNKETVVGSGELYPKEHSKRFKAENASLKLEQDKSKPENIRFTINGTDIFDWFKQKQKEFLNSLGINPKEKRGMKI